MQSFKTPAFQEEQQRIEEVFIQIPPPEPSANKANFSYRGGTTNFRSAPARSQPVSMTSYYNASGGCFTGDSILCMQDRLITASEVKKGMMVMSIDPTTMQKMYTEIVCVVKLRYQGYLHKVSDDMTLTPFHPIHVKNKNSNDGQSYFPCEYKRDEIYHDGYVYDVILKNRGLLFCVINEEEEGMVATFGHTSKMDKFEHKYFGSEAIVNDLKKFYREEFQNGSIVLEDYSYTRDPISCEVVAMQVSLECN